MSDRETERDTERDTDRQRQTDRQTDRSRDRNTNRRAHGRRNMGWGGAIAPSLFCPPPQKKNIKELKNNNIYISA